MFHIRDFISETGHQQAGMVRPVRPELSYLAGKFGLDDPELAAIHRQLAGHGLEYMSIAPAEARILQFLIRGFGIRRVVEIGALFGYSSIAMAKALPKDGRITALENDVARCAAATANARQSSVAARIEVRCGDAREQLRSIAAPIDMVFIDADKSGYLEYLDWAEDHVRPGGLIVGDNTFLFGALWGDLREGHGIGSQTVQVMEEFNRRLSNPHLYNSIMIATAEGMTIAQKL
ncbi:MAG: class I SAM-dependent methyltransferase [Alphaproteobacteria bacterium]|nr:class I SAM-dependent methyltransferase [Alphaproteobacteria bacterium]